MNEVKGATYIGMWMSLTKYPMKPMTAKPIATAFEIWMNSVQRHQRMSKIHSVLADLCGRALYTG